MHFKEDVLSQFKNMKSYERIDLVCSLMDLCLPFELRFLGTCLEFLGKRDFYELREDERLANNVNHLSQFRSLTDDNTRRKLVLYVSLLKSCNSDCANCINDTLAALCMNDVNLSCRSEGDSASKIIDEFLLLYTIALKHPAFSIHQKSEFATLLALLQEEDRKLTPNLHSSKDLISKSSENSSSDYLHDAQSHLQSFHFGKEENSSQISAESQASPLTCHVLSGSSCATDALSPTLSQASTASLGAAPSIDHSNTSPTNAPDLVSVVGGESPLTPLPIALPVSSNIVMGPGMIVPLASSASHCMLPSPSLQSSGEMGMQKGSLGPHTLLIGVPSESMMHVPYGHASWAMMMHIPGPAAGPDTPSVPSPPPVPEQAAIPTSGAISMCSSVCSLATPPCSTFSPATSTSPLVTSSPSLSSPISASKEVNSIPDNGLKQQSQASSPATSRDPTPTRKAQIAGHGKSVYQQPQQVQQMANQVHTFSPQMPLPYLYPYQSPTAQQQSPPPPPPAWDTSGDNLKDVIGREMPKYSSLQDYSPDELLHMGDDQLKEIGLPLSAIQQLRSIMGKLQVPNGITCSNRTESHFHDECVESRRRCPMDTKLTMSIPPIVPGPPVGHPYSYMVPLPHGIAMPSSNGGNCVKGNHRHYHHNQLVHQVRTLQLEDDNKRPCSNSSSTSDCSSGSHSPPETPHTMHWERGVDLGESWGCDRSREDRSQDDRVREDRLHEPERGGEERGRPPSHQPLGLQRNIHNSRSRGLSKAPPGIPSVPRGRGHHLMDKSRRDCVAMNGVSPGEVNPFPMSAGVPYAAFFPPGALPAMHGFHRFHGSFLPPPAYAYPSGEVWTPFPPHQPPPLMAPIVAYSPAHPPPKLSCYNCGGQGHQGSDCKEAPFEGITQQGQYHLDYKPSKEQGDCRDSDK